MQAATAAPSSSHSKVAVVSGEVRLKEADVELVGFAGCAVMLVSGAVRSIVQVEAAGVASRFPAGSFARTLNVCNPAASPVYAFGDVQAPYPVPSRSHSNVAVASGDEKVKEAEVEFVGEAGPEAIVVSGAVRSIVQVEAAGVASRLPAGSLARALNVCEPARREV